MNYIPKKIYVKKENGEYTVISFEKFNKLRETDTEFAAKMFVRLYYDTLVEFDKPGAKNIRSFNRHLKHLNENDRNHKLSYYGCVYVSDHDESNPAIQTEKNELCKKLLDSIDELEPIDRVIITGLFFCDLKEKEVAEIVGLNQSNVSRRKTKILQELRRKLTE